ncbi:hypothetical protein TCAL_12704, partial [Tigriopus californicus]
LMITLGLIRTDPQMTLIVVLPGEKIPLDPSLTAAMLDISEQMRFVKQLANLKPGAKNAMALKINAMFVGMTAVILGGHGAWLWVQQRKDIVGEHGGKEFPLITIARIATTGDAKPKDQN